MANITTIKLQVPTKKRIEKLRSYKRESYDEMLQKILEVLNLIRSDPDKARSKLIHIDRQKHALDAQQIKEKREERKQNSQTN